MFSTLGSFSAVYFSLAFLLFFIILFKNHLLILEERFDEWLRKKKKIRNNSRSSH
jgi:hypothetical protein